MSLNNYISKTLRRSKTDFPDGLGGGKPRYEFVDLAKGICILLVVFEHNVTGFNGTLDYMLRSFRMPLYFMLSGMFFSMYNGLGDFIVRKTNKLLIPFISFEIIASIIGAIVCGKELNLNLFSKCLSETLCNYPIWFLLCLFICGVIFYLVVLLSERIRIIPQYVCIILVSVTLGLVGFYLGKNRINIPFWADSALTALPFYAVGYCIRKYSHFLQTNIYRKWYIPLAVVLFTLSVFSTKSNIMCNDMSSTTVWQYYLLGISGTMAVLLFSKYFVKLPFLSYWGRYSICILVTHAFLFNFFLLPLSNYFMELYGIDVHILRLVTFVILMFAYQLIIPFMIKYLPHICAQKDIFVLKPKVTE